MIVDDSRARYSILAVSLLRRYPSQTSSGVTTIPAVRAATVLLRMISWRMLVFELGQGDAVVGQDLLVFIVADELAVALQAGQGHDAVADLGVGGPDAQAVGGLEEKLLLDDLLQDLLGQVELFDDRAVDLLHVLLEALDPVAQAVEEVIGRRSCAGRSWPRRSRPGLRPGGPSRPR